MSGNIQDFLDDVPTLITTTNNRLYDAVGSKSAATLLAEISVNTAGAGGGDATEAQQILQTALLTTIDADTGSMTTLQTSTNTKLDTINTSVGTGNTSLSAIATDAAALEVLQTTTNTNLGTINTSIGTSNTSLSAIATDAAALEVLQTTTNTNLGTINTSIGSGNTLLGTIDTSLNAIELDMAALETLQTSTNTKLDTLETSKSTSTNQALILTAVNSILALMGAATSNNVEFDYKTEYINSDTGTIVLENDKTGQYHIVADDCEIKQVKTIQMGENGQADYTIYIKVYSVGGGGVLTLLSTRTEAISVPSIVGMNSVNYYTNEPTKTDLVFHFPCDYSIDDVMNSGITIQGGSLVKQPRVGFRSYSSESRSGVYTSPFDLSSYGTAWTFAWWAKVINQNPISAFMRIFQNYDTISDVAGNIKQNGFEISIRNNAYNTKPYVDYSIICYNNTGSLINLTSAQADYGSSGTTRLFFNDATGKLFGVWTHFAFVKIDASNYKFYADGVLIGDILTASVITSPTNSGVQIGGCDNQWYHPQAVLCDDMRFYSSAVSAAEITKMTATSLSVAAGGLLLTDLDPAISVSKNQLIGVEVAETTAVDSGTEELLVTLVGLR